MEYQSAMETFNEEKLQKSLEDLEAWKQIAFMALVGARMIPNYERFSAETGFGNALILTRALDAAWTWVESGKLPDNLESLREACKQQAPNTEQFKSLYTSAALDAANAAEAILDAIEHPHEALPIEVASLARDTVDLFVQELIHLNPNAPGFEEAILSHNLMQRELLQQKEDIEALKNWPGDRQAAGREFRVRFAARTSGSLEV